MPDLSHVCVLVVEDNPDTSFIVQELLRHAGVRYINARASGRQIIKLIESRPDLRVNILLLDIHLPHEDGYMVLKKLRQLPTLAQTKIIAFTASAADQDPGALKAAGFDGLIGKPVDARRFPEYINNILAGEPVWETY